ncbi:MAG: hypothetical protein U9P72_05805 [Campylobacterota bacterium]|nr:hypothetical protein [Campylobacterota bacterium]
MKVLVVLILFSVFASASYETADKYYKSGKYEDAIKELKISVDEYSNPKLHLLWAKSAEALGDIDEVMSAYERVVMLDENSVESRVALIKIYSDSGRDELLNEMRDSLQNYQLTAKQRSSLELLKTTTSDSLKVKGSLLLGYDSNININPGSKILDNYYGSSGNLDEISTLFSRFNGRLSYVNELESKGGWYGRIDLIAYYQNNFDASYYNLFLGGADAGVGYVGDRYSLYLPLNYSTINYLDKNLLDQIYFKPRVDFTLVNNFLFSLNINYIDRAYTNNEDKYRDDTTVGIGTDMYYIFNKNFLYFSVKYENFSAKESSSFKYIDKDILTASLGVNYKLTPWLLTRFDYRYRDGSYEDDIGTISKIDRTKRADKYHQAELKLSHFFTKNYEVYISSRYAQNSSNYIPVEYNKNIIIFGISANY